MNDGIVLCPECADLFAVGGFQVEKITKLPQDGTVCQNCGRDGRGSFDKYSIRGGKQK